MPPAAPSPDRSPEPEGYVVVLDPDRVHFLDWGEPAPGAPTVLLIHGLAGTAWTWAPVARRIAGTVRAVAPDLRGHGLSDAPTEGYDADTLVDDVIAVLDGAGVLAAAGRSDPGEAGEPGTGSERSADRPAAPRVILAGHGFGGIVAAWTAARLGERCAGLVLVDGGWTDLEGATGMEPDEWLRGLEEPPEVMRSMASYLADRAGFDPGSWDADQERAARAAVVEVPAGHVVPVTRPHVLARSVEAMFGYHPSLVLPSVAAPIVALQQDHDELGRPGLAAAQSSLAAAGRPPIRVVECGPVGHNLPRYRADVVAEAILTLAAATMAP